MSTYFKEKVTFEKTAKVVSTTKNYEMDGPEYKLALWRDPSRKIISDLFETITTSREKLDEMSQEELEDLNDRFYEAVAQCIIDTNIEGLDFSTRESAERSMDDPRIDAGFFYDILVRYALDLLEESSALKKR